MAHQHGRNYIRVKVTKLHPYFFFNYSTLVCGRYRDGWACRLFLPCLGTLWNAILTFLKVIFLYIIILVYTIKK